MTIMLCVDDRGGRTFNGRRQSQDRLLRQKLLKETEGHVLWMDAYSKKQFSNLDAPCIQVAEHPLEQAGPEDFCFLERQDPVPYLAKGDRLILYRWNRHYPADPHSTLPPEGWRLVSQEEFPGFSHDTITKEVYEL